MVALPIGTNEWFPMDSLDFETPNSAGYSTSALEFAPLKQSRINDKPALGDRVKILQGADQGNVGTIIQHSAQLALYLVEFQSCEDTWYAADVLLVEACHS